MSLYLLGIQVVAEVDLRHNLVVLSYIAHYLQWELCMLIIELIYFENVHGIEL
jgi:hypothetical protein